MSFYERLTSLCADEGIAVSNLGQFIKVDGVPISRSAIDTWRRGVRPRNATLKAIADHFRVDVAFLLGDDSASAEPGKQPSSLDCSSCVCKDNCKCSLSEQEHQLVKMFRSISEIGKMRFIKQILTIWEQDQEE